MFAAIRRILLFWNEPIGRRGERLAAKWLKKRGYRILECNFTMIDDEADLVSLDPDGRTVVIVEVKTRKGATAQPEIAVNGNKRFNLARLASRMQRVPQFRDHPLRFDVVAVNLSNKGEATIRHIPGAFQSPW